MRAPPILERSILGFPLRRVNSNIKSLRPGVKENLPSPVRVYVCFLVFNILLHAARRAMKMAGGPYQMIILRHQATVLGYVGAPLSPPHPLFRQKKRKKRSDKQGKGEKKQSGRPHRARYSSILSCSPARARPSPRPAFPLLPSPSPRPQRSYLQEEAQCLAPCAVGEAIYTLWPPTGPCSLSRAHVGPGEVRATTVSAFG